MDVELCSEAGREFVIYVGSGRDRPGSVREHAAKHNLTVVMIDKKVGPNTTVEDVYAAYPEIEKEIDDEINEHQWSKDVN